MKTLASMVGIGVISMTVALAPVFAQQTKPMDQPSGTATVQPKTDTSMPASGTSGKDDKTLPAKPGAAVKNETVPAKPAPEVKSGTATVQPKAEAKAPVVNPTGKDDKTLPGKPGPAVKSETVPAKPAPEVKSGTATVQPKAEAKAPVVKSGTVSGKSETGAKDAKSAPVKPGATLKNDKPAKSVPQVKAEGKKPHVVKKASHKKVSSKTHAKAVTAPRDTDKKVEQGNTAGVPSVK